MRFLSLLTAAAFTIGGIALPGAASAHARVTASTPAEGASIPRPRTLSLTFAEAVDPAVVAASIVMTAMPGMTDHPPMTIRNFTPAWSKDSRTLTLNLREPLPIGSYDLRWQAGSEDGHRMTGKVSFTVR